MQSTVIDILFQFEHSTRLCDPRYSYFLHASPGCCGKVAFGFFSSFNRSTGRQAPAPPLGLGALREGNLRIPWGSFFRVPDPKMSLRQCDGSPRGLFVSSLFMRLL